MKERFGATVEWLPFDLHGNGIGNRLKPAPDAISPPGGVPRDPERAARGAALFERYGLVYNPPPVSPRSLDAQRLAEHARAQELYVPFFERTMDAYWTEARDIGDHGVLRTLAEETGVEEADEVLAGDRYADEVARSTAAAHSLGVNGIPAFLLDRRLLVLGAHPRETFEKAFEQLGG
jgi:predicted DsbA family dithiol-disulfide isomerase